MLRTKFSVSIFIPVIVSILSCQPLPSSLHSKDYLAGKKAARAYAKQDAIKANCFGYPTRTALVARKNLKIHLTDLKLDKSEQYIKGFSRAYKINFLDYLNNYCGNY